MRECLRKCVIGSIQSPVRSEKNKRASLRDVESNSDHRVRGRLVFCETRVGEIGWYEQAGLMLELKGRIEAKRFHPFRRIDSIDADPLVEVIEAPIDGQSRRREHQSVEAFKERLV